MKKIFVFLLVIICLCFTGCTAKVPETITAEEAEKLCAEVLGDYAEETGFPISYKCTDEIDFFGKEYYVMHISWLVNNSHLSYIGNAFVTKDGKAIYDGVVSGEEFEITSLRWQK